jgi:uncharacterized protein
MKLPSVVVRFLVLVLFFSWILTIPLWKHPGHLEHPFAGIIILFFMFTPALSALYISFISNDPDKQNLFAIRMGKNWRRHWIFQWISWPTMTFAALFISDTLGWYEFDIENSGFAEWLSLSINQVADSSGQPLLRLPMTYKQMVWSYCILIFLSPLLLWIITIGQELAWRGWVLSKLMILGTKNGIIFSSLLWGVWYIPLILLGHRYPDHSVIGVFLTFGFCIIIGAFLSWSRIQTNSIWPSIIGHSMILASFPLAHLFYKQGSVVTPELVGLTGISGWFIPLLILVVMIRKKMFDTQKPFIEQRR